VRRRHDRCGAEGAGDQRAGTAHWTEPRPVVNSGHAATAASELEGPVPLQSLRHARRVWLQMQQISCLSG
jgi:hypothetical protein